MIAQSLWRPSMPVQQHSSHGISTDLGESEKSYRRNLPSVSSERWLTLTPARWASLSIWLASIGEMPWSAMVRPSRQRNRATARVTAPSSHSVACAAVMTTVPLARPIITMSTPCASIQTRTWPIASVETRRCRVNLDNRLSRYSPENRKQSFVPGVEPAALPQNTKELLGDPAWRCYAFRYFRKRAGFLHQNLGIATQSP